MQEKKKNFLEKKHFLRRKQQSREQAHTFQLKAYSKEFLPRSHEEHEESPYNEHFSRAAMTETKRLGDILNTPLERF